MLVACYAQRVNTRARVELQVALNVLLALPTIVLVRTCVPRVLQVSMLLQLGYQCALHVQQVKQPPRLAQEAARHALQASMLEMIPVVLTVFLVLILLQELKHVLVVKQENISARVEQVLVLYVHLESIQG